MVRTILVPLDGSPLAERALPYAERLAQASAAQLVLTRAALAHARPLHELDEAQAAAIDEAERYLQDTAKRISAEGFQVEYALPYGEAAAEILEEIQIRQAGLVVMATHGRSGIGRWLYGSVADEVLRQAEVPVMLMPPLAQTPWPTDRPLRVLVPLDSSATSEAILPPLADLAKGMQAELLLFQVVSLPAYDGYQEEVEVPPFNPDAEMATSTAYLEGIAGPLRAQGLQVNTHVTLGRPVSALVDQAQEQGMDLIAMATHGRSGLARLVLGSVATGTLRRATVPLLLVRPAALTAEGETQPHATTLQLSRAEVGLVEQLLNEALNDAERYGPRAGELRALNTRLRQAAGQRG